MVIDVPKDVQNWEGPYDSESVLQLHGYQERVNDLRKHKMDAETARRFFQLLKRSKKPLLYVGGGVIISGATQELRTFMRTFQIPAVTTLMGISALDTTDDLCLNMLGMHGAAYANYAVDECDFLIAIGARFDDRVAGSPKHFAANAAIAHIDIDGAEIGKVKAADWSYVGDAGIALRDLLEAGKSIEVDHQPWLDKVLEMKRYRFNCKRSAIQQAVLK